MQNIWLYIIWIIICRLNEITNEIVHIPWAIECIQLKLIKEFILLFQYYCCCSLFHCFCFCSLLFTKKRKQNPMAATAIAIVAAATAAATTIILLRILEPEAI